MGKKLVRNHPQKVRTSTATATSWTKVQNQILFLGRGFNRTGRAPPVHRGPRSFHWCRARATGTGGGGPRARRAPGADRPVCAGPPHGPQRRLELRDAPEERVWGINWGTLGRTAMHRVRTAGAVRAHASLGAHAVCPWRPGRPASAARKGAPGLCLKGRGGRSGQFRSGLQSGHGGCEGGCGGGGGYWRLEMRLGLALGCGNAFGVESGPEC